MVCSRSTHFRPAYPAHLFRRYHHHHHHHHRTPLPLAQQLQLLANPHLPVIASPSISNLMSSTLHSTYISLHPRSSLLNNISRFYRRRQLHTNLQFPPPMTPIPAPSCY
ncbi:hypothetical protein E2C01_026711 [Portunus trituberculatus]|uniref:Uncharacterized protein n=1 Tax=Portunus trituberculatus TaxID=210409 RepID=A0A5B7EJY3_PORTR|nr:hypothetical protein [Portunus trituberculatus]